MGGVNVIRYQAREYTRERLLSDVGFADGSVGPVPYCHINAFHGGIAFSWSDMYRGTGPFYIAKRHAEWH